jgi:hypothetical protein
MTLRQRIFLTRQTLPLIDGLLDKLDGISGEVVERSAYLWFYNGLSARLERDRLTEEEFLSLPARIKAILRADWKKWKSEARWIDVVRKEDPNAPESLSLRLLVTEDNIDQIENMSCNEILADIEERTRSAYKSIPTRRELCDRWGDINNQRMYMFRDNAERKWLDLFLRQNSMPVDRQLLWL